MIWCIYICIGISVMAFVYGIFQIRFLKLEKDPSIRTKTRVVIFDLFKPLILVFAAYNQKLNLDSFRVKYKKSLIISGNPLHILPDEFFAIKELSAIAGILFGIFIVTMLEANPIFVLVFAICGFFLPNLSLTQSIMKRKHLIFLDLPFQMDLLNLAVEAGLTFTLAIGEVVNKGQPGPLREEFEKMLTDLRLGVSPIESLKGLADRTDMYEIRSFTTALIQAEKLGTPISNTLKSQSEIRRTERFQRAEKMAQEAPVKMLLPLIAFIFPAVFIIILTPIILKFIAEGM